MAILAVMDERIELMRRAYQTFNEGDVDYSLFHPEVWHILSFRDGLLSRMEVYPSRRRALAAAQPS
jgi:hypothetical protein